jgi:hypothetical protein
MTISDIQLYELLASKLGRPEAKGLVEFVEARVDKKLDEKTNTLASKEDISNVTKDIAFLKQEVFSVKTEMAGTKVDLIKWVVATGFALASLMIALMVGMIKYLHAVN